MISLQVLLSIAGGVLGAVGAYIRLKSTIDVHKVQISNLIEENKGLHKRMDSIKDVVNKNREHADQSTTDLKQFINDMKVEIIREIHSKQNEK